MFWPTSLEEFQLRSRTPSLHSTAQEASSDVPLSCTMTKTTLEKVTIPIRTKLEMLVAVFHAALLEFCKYLAAAAFYYFSWSFCVFSDNF